MPSERGAFELFIAMVPRVKHKNYVILFIIQTTLDAFVEDEERNDVIKMRNEERRSGKENP